MKHIFSTLTLLSLFLINGCLFKSGTHRPRTSQVKRIDRSQRRSLARAYSKMIASHAYHTLHTNTAHSEHEARQAAEHLAKKTDEVAQDVALYRSIGLSERAERRYNTVINATQKKIAAVAHMTNL